MSKNSEIEKASFGTATYHLASSTYAKDDIGFNMPPAIKGNPCLGDCNGAMDPIELIGSMFHCISRNIAYRFATSTENPLP